MGKLYGAPPSADLNERASSSNVVTAMPKLGRGRILIWEGGSLWIMEAVSPNRQRARLNDPHAHHAVQVTLALEGDFEFESGDRRASGDVVAIAPDALHAFNARGLFAHVYIEPECRAGRAAANALFAGDAPLARVTGVPLDDLAAELSAAFKRKDDRDLTQLGRSVIERLAGGTRAAEPDARVREILAWVQTRLDYPVSLADAADLAGLSKARVRHLFVEQTGLPFRTYLLWLRLMRGLEAFASGASLTDAALGAGFADSAHFSRTFRRMFGTAAAALDVS
jgi:AraC family transcriptional regulator